MSKRLSEITKILAVLLWAGLTGLRLIQSWQEANLIPALLATQAAFVTFLMVNRRNESVPVPWKLKVTAWASALLPLAVRIEHETDWGQVISVAGLMLMLWALDALGYSFGIAPADRGLVIDGPYRWVRHPMYLGELISLTGAVLASPSPWNSLVLHVLLVTLLLRMRWEERIVFGYSAYAGRVRWRLIPFIF